MRNTKNHLPQKTLVAVLIGSLFLTGCGGGGGGGGSSGGGGSGGVIVAPGTGTPTPTPTLNPVPFATPTRAGTVQPQAGAINNMDSTTMTAVDLNRDGTQEIVLAGAATAHSPTPNPDQDILMSVWGWKDGSFQNVTANYFKPGENRIGGTSYVQTGDFNGDGKVDLYVGPNTDNSLIDYEYAYIAGADGKFNKTRISDRQGYVPMAAVYDLTGSGRSDIVTTFWSFHFGNADGTFTNYEVGAGAGRDISTKYFGNSAIVAADFLNNGTSTFVTTDSYNVDLPANEQRGGTRLMSWRTTANGIEVNQVAELPQSRFAAPKWAGYNFTYSHSPGLLAFDFDNSGKTSVVVVSQPAIVSGGITQWPNFSEVQFLKNQGGGSFIDVTDNVLVGYNTNTRASANPHLADVNSDGLMDIVLAAGDSTQILVHTREHKYVASYATVINAFQGQAAQIEAALGSANTSTEQNAVVFVKGPDNNLYMATAINFVESGTNKKSIYITKLGATTMNAQATATAIRQAWPWMTDGQVNQVLAQSSTTWLNMNLLDPAKAMMSPIGQLGVYVNGQFRQLTGSLGGISLNGAANNLTIFDSTNRAFSMNYSSSNYKMNHFWSSNIHDPIVDDTRSAVGSSWTGMQMTQIQVKSPVANMGFVQGEYGTGMFDEAIIKMGTNQSYQEGINPYTGTYQNRAFAYAITNIKPFSDRNFAMNVQYTNLPFSPHFQMSGVWGSVNSTSMVETSASYRYKGLVGKAGVINSNTDIQSGLVNNITPITSVWGEVGHEWKVVKAYVGVFPKIVAGQANISLPTGVDQMGNTQYNNINAGVNNPLVGYARVQMFNFTDRARTKSYSVNGIVGTDNNKAIMANFTHRF